MYIYMVCFFLQVDHFKFDWTPYFDNCATLLPDLSGGLDIVVSVRLPDADGLLSNALQQTWPAHQGCPHTGGAHIHANVVNVCHNDLDSGKIKHHG